MKSLSKNAFFKAPLLIVTAAVVVLSLFSLTGCSKKEDGKGAGLKSSSLVRELDVDDYRKLVFDFEKGNSFEAVNELPVLIDFYAVWCQPCKMMAPVLDKLSLKYEGKVHFYKVNAEEKRILSSLHGIRAYPTVHFIPPGASASDVGRETGYRGEAELEGLIESYFGVTP